MKRSCLRIPVVDDEKGGAEKIGEFFAEDQYIVLEANAGLNNTILKESAGNEIH